MASKHTKKTKGIADPIDIHVGQRLRLRRSLQGMSQEKLAGIVNITFQQIQKYERGMNRISASRLYQFSKALDVPISYFYDQFGTATGSIGNAPGFSDTAQEEFGGAEDIMKSKETISLIKSYYAIKDPEKRKSIVRFIKSMADNEEN
ncbi:MAG TPA: transcriptional regulator [Rhodospirillaceae bacterium]|nr:transcriptional regulator [Rhodospirillaceae bacterium]